jgi:transcriptional regulator with XRE-family HTH domain
MYRKETSHGDRPLRSDGVMRHFSAGYLLLPPVWNSLPLPTTEIVRRQTHCEFYTSPIFTARRNRLILLILPDRHTRLQAAHMHRGVRVDGPTIKRLRKANGLSQQRLAQAAGIAERTVRNAEKGLVLEYHIAGYLASALEVSLSEIITERAPASRSSRLNGLVRKVSSSYMKAVLDVDKQALIELVHPGVEWSCYSAPDQSFSGCFRGRDQLRKHLKLASRWWEQFVVLPGDLTISRTDCEGEMVYFLLAGKVQDESKQLVEIWQTFICRFDEDLLISVDQSMGVIPIGTNVRTASS